MINIRKLETELWEAADLLRADSKVTSQEYCMPVLGLIFLRYAYSRFKFVESEILKNRPVRNGRVLPVEADDFKTKSAIFLPEEARYDYLLNLPDNTDMGQAINHAMELVEAQSAQLKGILPKNYTILQNDLLRELLRIFNNSAFNEMKDDIIGRIYEYFLNKFAPAVASDDGVFFTPKSLVRMIVNVIEPTHGTVLDPACGSGGMFVSSADFIEQYGANANTAMTFFGQEKVDYNAKLCIMNMAVHGLNAKIVSGDEANSFYHDAHNLEGSCDYVMANPPFNVDKVKSETAQNAGRLPFGLPGVNKNKEIGNANYLWILPPSESNPHKHYSKYFTRDTLSDEKINQLKASMSKILGKNYTDIELLSYNTYRLFEAHRNGILYTGFNMGAGENAVLYLLLELLSAGIGALIVIDEIELGLHVQAQKRLVEELKFLCKKYKCQIICSTHSRHILDRLPPEGRLYIKKSDSMTEIIPQISSQYAFGKLSGENSKELDVFVEDDVGKSFLQACLPQSLRERINIIPVGSDQSVLKHIAVHYREDKHNYIAYLDGDKSTQKASAKTKIREHLETRLNETEADFDSYIEKRLNYLPGKE